MSKIPAVMSAFTVRRLESIDERALAGLIDVLIDCVEGGASVNFMQPMTLAKAADILARGRGELHAANVRWWSPRMSDGAIIGTAQAVWAAPENQPHRADIAKMLVHRRARRLGVGAAVLTAAEHAARDAGRRCWCSTPRAPKPNGSTNAAAGNASAPFRDTR